MKIEIVLIIYLNFLVNRAFTCSSPTSVTRVPTINIALPLSPVNVGPFEVTLTPATASPTASATVSADSPSQSAATSATPATAPSSPQAYCGTNSYSNPNLVPSISARILGGYNSMPYEFPWMAYLDIYNRNTQSRFPCGGSLISPYWVLTSARCCSNGVFAWDVTVKLGGNSVNNFIMATTAAQMIIHPQFNQGTLYNNDFCLLRLQSQANVADGRIQPICLPPDGCQWSTCQVGESAVVTGWGSTSLNGPTAVNLARANVPIVANTTCSLTYPGLTDRMICAGYAEGGVDACSGDGGGPLQCLKNGVYTIDGVVSFGKGCGIAGYPGVYARVCSARQWLVRCMSSGGSDCSASTTDVTSQPTSTSSTSSTAGSSTMPTGVTSGSSSTTQQWPVVTYPTMPTMSTSPQPTMPWWFNLTGSTMPPTPPSTTTSTRTTMTRMMTTTTGMTRNNDCGQGSFTGANYGSTAQAGEFPWHVFLYIYNRLQAKQAYTYCGGVVVNRSGWVLTAARCCQSVFQASDIIIYVSGNSLSSSFTFGTPAFSMAMHPQYQSGTGVNDYCMVKANIPAAWQSFWNIVPVCLPFDCNQNSCQSGDVAVATSWGSTQLSGSPSAILQKGYVPVYANGYCQNVFNAFVNDNKTCTGPSAGSCSSGNGDDGGVLMCSKKGVYVVDGILSLGNCLSPNAPIIYNKICTVRDWVTSFT